MTEQSQADTDESAIKKTIAIIFSTLHLNAIDPQIAYAALTIASASIAANSQETDEHIVGEYQKCLTDARIRHGNSHEGSHGCH